MEADKNKPHLSRAAAAAHRRLSASEARRKPASEVMLVSSKSFPSQQYQELLTFIKGLQLPPDVTLLFTTVPNERVAERKAAAPGDHQRPARRKEPEHPEVRPAARRPRQAVKRAPVLMR